MRSGRPRPVPPRARDVLAYFLLNPDALDTLEGVARWRVQQEAVHLTIEQVGHALDWLVERGFLEDSTKGSARLFHLNQDQALEAELFMANLMQHTFLETKEPSSGGSPVMRRALEWLDAVLLRYLHENQPHANDQPGLTRSFESVEAILTRRNAGNGDDVEAARQIAGETSLALAEACEEAGPNEPLAVLYRELSLTWLELETVLLCLAPELDSGYQLVYGVLNDEMSRRTPTLGLISRILGNPLAVRTELAATAGLTRWRLIDSGGALPHADEPLRLETPLISWLLGLDGSLLSDPRIRQCVRSKPWPGGKWLKQAGDIRKIESLADRFNFPELKRWLALCGEDADGWRALAEAAAVRGGAPVVRLTTPPAGMDFEELEDLGSRITRAVLLLNATVILDLGIVNGDAEGNLNGWAARIIGELTRAGRAGVVIAPELERVLGSFSPGGCDVDFRSLPDSATLAGAYLAAMGEAGLYLSQSDAAQVALAFPLPLSGIESAVRLAVLQGADRQSLAGQCIALTAACRKVASPDLPRFARRMEPTFSLDDVVLPKDRQDQLREIVAHVKYASQVLNTWGFSGQLPYGRGVAALFCGPSGTGKTMAAQAIARELNTETFVVDLSRVVSKYIGETEKFIDATFRDAQRAGAVLQIDEAEALFGKRSEIKDAHDRYANLEVAYLLQRMEAYDGVAILTTNFRQNLDQAFLRRLRFVVDFPKPDAAAREAIWLRCLPKDAPFRDINIRFLARRLELTGGHIRQITVRAAFAAAGQGSESIEMKHLVEATRAELLKLGMPSAERELAEFEAAQRSAAARVA